VRAVDDRAQAEVAVAFQRRGAVAEAAEPADRVVHAGGVVVRHREAVRVDDARRPAAVGAAGHLAVGVLHAGRRGSVHRPAVRLVLLDELSQPVEGPMHLVDDVAADRRAVASEQVGLPGRVEGRLAGNFVYGPTYSEVDALD
jgi:hypothetical protein